MKLSKLQTFLAVVLLSSIVAGIIFIYRSNPARKPLPPLEGRFSAACGTYLGKGRDVCLSEMATEKEDEEACHGIHDSLIKDICYRDVSLARQRWPVLVDDDSCYFISDSVLQYLCLRTFFRPHILGFQIRRPLHASVESNGAAPECENYTPYHRLFCIYHKAILLAPSDLQAAVGLCNEFEDWSMNGACMIHIATALSLHLNTTQTSDVGTIKKFCEGTSHPSWKSECYFILADELTLLSPIINFSEITSLCEESNRAVNYACISHVAQLMPLSAEVAFCLMQNESYQHDCFVNAGAMIGRAFIKDIPAGTTMCTTLPASSERICMSAFAFSIGEETSGDVSLKQEKCREIPEEARDFCFMGISSAISEQYFNDTAVGMEVCNELPAFSSACVEGVVWMEGVRSQGNLSRGIERCNRFPPYLRKNCFSGLSVSFAGRLPPEASRRIAACLEFPEQFRGECFATFGWTIGNHYIYNPSQGALLCVENAGIYAQECAEGLGRHLAIQAVENIGGGVKTCAEFPEEIRRACFTGMAREMLSMPLYQTDPCDAFPEEYRSVCQEKPVD